MCAMMLASIAKCSRDYRNLVPLSAMMLASIAECSRDYPKFTPFGRKSNRILFKSHSGGRNNKFLRLCDFVIDYVGFPTRQRGLKGLFDYRRGLPHPPVVEDPIGAPASLHQGTNKTLYGSCCCVNAVGTALLCRPPRQKVMSFAAEIIEISCQ